MSRFFRSGDSSEEEDSGSDEEQVVVDSAAASARFIMDSSSSEEEKRTVKTEKDKRYDDLQATIKTMKNHLKINDWVAISKDFEVLVKKLGKAKNIVRKEGIPKFYWAAVLLVDASMKAAFNNKAEKKKMSSSNSKALTGMKQRLRKYLIQYEKEVKKYNKDPLVEEEEDEKSSSESGSESESESESEEEEKPKKKAAKKASKKESDSDESDSEDGSGDDTGDDDDDSEDTEYESLSSDSESDIELNVGQQYTRDFWVKKDWNKKKMTKDEEEADRKERERKKQERRAKAALEKEAAKQKQLEAASKDAGKEAKELTPEAIIKKLKEIIALIGKKTTDKEKVVADLKVLAEKAEGAVLLKISMTLLSATFDLSLNRGLYMPIANWKECVSILKGIIKTLGSNPKIRLSEDDQDAKETFDDEDEDYMSLESLMAPEDEEEAEKLAEEKAAKAEERRKKAEANSNGIQYVLGNLYSFIQRMVAEYMNSLQNIDPHIPEYVERLKDDTLLLDLVKDAQDYYKTIEKVDFECNTALLRISLLYYQYDPAKDNFLAETKSLRAAVGDDKSAEAKATGKDEVMLLTTLLYKHGDPRSKAHALLSHVYYLAVHNRYSEARDLFLMSHVQDNVHEFDIRTRILFNRTTAMLGLCAFRTGEYTQALYCLSDLYQSSRIKELIAQGLSTNRYHDKDPIKEKLEKKRQYPYHMHMNLDMLESVHLVAAMLEEVPNLAIHGTTDKRRVISKAFRRLFDHNQRQAFSGPPESTRDVIMAATKALQLGDWERCCDFVKRLRMWKLFNQPELVKSLITQEIKQVALRTYLLANSHLYTSISLDSLCTMFSLDATVVHRSISKMMVNDELEGAWDQPSGCILLSGQATKPTRLQKIALQYADKVNLYVEQNEHLLKQNGRGGYSGGGDRGGGRGFGGGYSGMGRGGAQVGECYAYRAGNCTRGDSCRYSHNGTSGGGGGGGYNNNRSNYNSGGGGGAGECWAFRAGNCTRGSSCRYSHT